MFGFFKRKPANYAVSPLRETLFGDIPLEQWKAHVPEASAALSPWKEFLAAEKEIATGDATRAELPLRQVLAISGLESRFYLEAWTALRSIGIEPPTSEAKKLLGVVVEVGITDGLDIVAAWPDGSARYLNHSGAAVIWDHPDDSLRPQIDALLASSNPVVQKIGPWKEARPAAPTAGRARVSFLTPSGLHFGEGPMGPFTTDPLAGPVLATALALMQALMAKSRSVGAPSS